MRDCIKAPYFTKNKVDETSVRKVRATAKKVNGKSRICSIFKFKKVKVRSILKAIFYMCIANN